MGLVTHQVHEHATGIDTLDVLVPAAGVVLLACSYVFLVRAAARRNPVRGWKSWRTASFLTGCVLLACALLPPVASFAQHDFRGHMIQHVLVGMYAPLALVLGAPVTLLLRALPTMSARRVTAFLRARPVGLIASPPAALVLSTGALAALYFTPLYNAVMREPALHSLVNVHFLLTGCLFAWVIAGPDPAPARPGVPARLVILGIAVAAHATISQLVYGGFLIDVHAPIVEVQGGAQIMYYGGDLAELLLAAALIATWRPAPAEHNFVGRTPDAPAARAGSVAAP
jgi:putative membrane protein